MQRVALLISLLGMTPAHAAAEPVKLDTNSTPGISW